MRMEAGETKKKKEMILRDHKGLRVHKHLELNPQACAALLKTQSVLDLLKNCHLNQNLNHQKDSVSASAAVQNHPILLLL